MQLSNYWNIQLYLQGELVSIDIVEEAEVQSITEHFKRKGYEVRSEPAWKPAQSICQNGEITRQEQPRRAATCGQIFKLTDQEARR